MNKLDRLLSCKQKASLKRFDIFCKEYAMNNYWSYCSDSCYGGYWVTIKFSEESSFLGF